MICAGIDAGSRAIKIVLLDADTRELIACGVADQGIEPERRACCLLDRLLDERGATRSEVTRVVATGYARNSIGIAETTVTEITCHARGVHHLMPDAQTVIEIGGQDSKLLRLQPNGMVRDFVMNDRCAAGSGRFLEVVASRLGVAPGAYGALVARSTQPAAINSTCVVFAETEIIGLLAAGTAPEEIAAGVQAAIARRVAAMAGGKIVLPIVFTGGVALLPGMAEALTVAVGHPVRPSPLPQYTGALGAALLACR